MRWPSFTASCPFPVWIISKIPFLLNNSPRMMLSSSGTVLYRLWAACSAFSARCEGMSRCSSLSSSEWAKAHCYASRFIGVLSFARINASESWGAYPIRVDKSTRHYYTQLGPQGACTWRAEHSSYHRNLPHTSSQQGIGASHNVSLACRWHGSTANRTAINQRQTLSSCMMLQAHAWLMCFMCPNWFDEPCARPMPCMISCHLWNYCSPTELYRAKRSSLELCRYLAQQKSRPRFFQSRGSIAIASALPSQFLQFLRAMSGGNQGFKVDSGERWWPTDAYAIVTGGQ